MATALWVSLSRMSVETLEANTWKRLAYVCRYGHIGLDEALHTGTRELNKFAKALSEIVEEENAPKRG